MKKVCSYQLSELQPFGLLLASSQKLAVPPQKKKYIYPEILREPATSG